MNTLEKILVGLVTIGIISIGLIFVGGLASSSTDGFSKLSVSLKEGDTITVTYLTTIETRFVLEPLYPFENYQKVLLFSPDKLDNSGNITIHLVNLSLQEKETIVSDNYRFRLSAYDDNNLVNYLIIYTYIGKIKPDIGSIDNSILENYITIETYSDFKRFVIDQFNLLNAYIGIPENENSNEIIVIAIENLRNLMLTRFSINEGAIAFQEDKITKQDEEISSLRNTLNTFIAVFVSLFVIGVIGTVWKLISRAKPAPAKKRTAENVSKIQETIKFKKQEEEESKKKMEIIPRLPEIEKKEGEPSG